WLRTEVDAERCASFQPGAPGQRRATRVSVLENEIPVLLERRADPGCRLDHLLVGLVLGSWPEEALEPITFGPRHHVHVQVWDALTDGVVVGDERSLRPERLGNHTRNTLHAL